MPDVPASPHQHLVFKLQEIIDDLQNDDNATLTEQQAQTAVLNSILTDLQGDDNATETTLQAVLAAVDGLELSVDNIDLDMDDVEALIAATNVALVALQSSNETHSDEEQAKLDNLLTELQTQQKDALTDAELRAAPLDLDDFDRIAKARAVVGEELRFDDVIGGDLYIGAAPEGTATSAASWDVVRYYRTAAGAITRQRYQTGIAWDDRATGWT